MNKYALIVLLAWVISLASNVEAKELKLVPGEAYRKGDLTVTCGQASTDKPLALNNCQYWDDFNNKCLFEKTSYVYKNLECAEECQHWDKFKSTCYYQSKCSFYPSNQTFVQTTCEKFDDFNNICLKMKEKKIEQ